MKVCKRVAAADLFRIHELGRVEVYYLRSNLAGERARVEAGYSAYPAFPVQQV